MQADMFVVDNVIAGSAWPRARLDGRFYNDTYANGVPGSGYLGEIYAEVAIGWTSTGLRGWWWVGRYAGATSSSPTLLPNGSGYFSTAITPGVTYPLYIGYDGTNKFTFRIGSEQYTFTGPARAGNAKNPWKSLTTRVQIDDPGSSGYISVTFDNVVAKDGSGVVVVSDDFSSPTIDKTKWTAYEYVREISGGKFRSKARSSSATTSSVTSRLDLLYPSEIRAIQTKVTPLAYQNADGASVRARVAGIFYNDGTQGGGYIGDVGGQVRIGGTESNPKAEWVVFTFTDVDGKCSQMVASGTFNTSILLGNTYILFLAWDGWQFTFKIGNEVAYYVPETGVYPPNNPWKALETSVYYNCTDPTGKEASIEALFDDVMVSGPMLSLSPASYNFGNLIAPTTSPAQTFTLSNNGSTNIGIGSIDVVGDDAAMFNIVSATCPGLSSTLSPKGLPTAKCNIVASFQPTSEGAKSAALRFTLNTPDNPAIFMPLKGTGLLETISAPTTLVGPPGGTTTTGTTYTFTTGGSSSNLTPPTQHPIQYLFEWDDGTNSGWLPVGTTSAKKIWTSSGTYNVKAMARCATHKPVASSLSPGISVNITIPIHPTSPLIGSPYNVSSLYYPNCYSTPIPTFGWTVDETFAKGYKIQFSTDFKFKSISLEVPSLMTPATIPKATWQTILSKPGKSGGVLYWRVVGTRSNATIATSEISFIFVDLPQPVLNPMFSHHSKTATPPPTITWKNNYNKQFKVYVANDPDFSKPGIKKFASPLLYDDPCADAGTFDGQLGPSDWASVYGVVNGVVGSWIYWYVESTDILVRSAKTEVMSFVLQP